MKKLLCSLFFICSLFTPAYATDVHLAVLEATEESPEFFSEISDTNLYETPVFLEEKQDNPIVRKNSENIKFHSYVAKTFQDIYELEVENTKMVPTLLEKPLTWNINKGPVNKIHLWGGIQTNMDSHFRQGGNTDVTYRVNLVNPIFDVQLNDGKEDFRLMLNVTQPSEQPYMKYLLQDLYIQTHRIQNHRILFGNFRPGVGIEGEQSPYTLPLWTRSQISRNFSAVRKVGLRVKGNYSFVDYDLGGYSSDTYFSEFMPGAEFNGWVNVKPLAKMDEKYGQLVTGAGISTGERHNVNYLVNSAYLGYEYKKMWLRTEYANADGSNGATGLTAKHREGWHTTLGYHLTKKIELVARYDELNQDKKVSHNNRREYTAGVNYYLKGQALKLVLNYIYSQTQNKLDSHRFLVGTQIIL